MFNDNKKIISDLTEAFDFWQNKLGGLRIALNIVKNYNKKR